jgi:hypothetical protein
MAPEPDSAILFRNLESLRPADPALADRITALDLTPFNPTPTLTRDRQLSFRFTGPDGQPHWLGRSSIPATRAAALLEQFDPGQANVLLPSFGEGTEAQNLLKKLEPHRVIFIWEPDLLAVRLVLTLKDFAGALATKRLVILQCSAQDLTAVLTDWLIRHRSIPCPNRLMMWPWQTPAEMAQCRSAVETAWQKSVAAP